MGEAPIQRRQPVATLKAVAALAGCSTATVSKALNGIIVSPENLRRVLAAAEELGYVPNSVARSLRGDPTMTVGLVMNVAIHPQHELLAVLDTLIRELEQAGYSVLLSIPQGIEGSLQTVLRRFVERRVDGLFFWNAQADASLAWYERAGIPVLAVGFRDAGCDTLPLLTADGGPAFEAAFRRLASLGHQVVGELGDRQASIAHRANANAAGLRWRYFGTGNDDAQLAAAMASLAHLTDPATGDDRPTALAAPYPVAVKILAICDRLGLRVPRDLSLLATTDSDAAALLRVPLSAIHTDFSQIGHAAAGLMLRAMTGGELTDQVVRGCIDYVERASIAAVIRRPVPVRAARSSGA